MKKVNKINNFFTIRKPIKFISQRLNFFNLISQSIEGRKTKVNLDNKNSRVQTESFNFETWDF